MEFEMLKKVIADVLKIDPKEIKPETTFADDLGADSLDLLQIVMGLEEAFNITFAEEDIAGIVTVEDAVNKIRTTVNM